MRIPIVNEKDEVVKYIERNELAVGDTFRVAGLWVYDKEGNILLARRALSKKRHPGLWSVAVAGTVEENETYDSNIVKEMEEELGIVGYIPKKVLKDYREADDGIKRWATHYNLILPREYQFTLREDEVIETKWYTPQELVDDVTSHPEKFTSTFLLFYKDFLKYEN